MMFNPFSSNYIVECFNEQLSTWDLPHISEMTREHVIERLFCCDATLSFFQLIDIHEYIFEKPELLVTLYKDMCILNE